MTFIGIYKIVDGNISENNDQDLTNTRRLIIGLYKPSYDNLNMYNIYWC